MPKPTFYATEASVARSFVVELVFDVELDVGILAENIERNEQQKGVYIGSALAQMGKDVNPQQAEQEDEEQKDIGSNAHRSSEMLGLVAHFHLHHIKQLGHKKGIEKEGLADLEKLLRIQVAVRLHS